MQNNFSRRQQNEQGFSLIELMMAMVIFTIVGAAVFGTLRIGVIMQNSITDRSESLGSARTATNIIGRDAVNAGLGLSRDGIIVPNNLANELFSLPKDSNVNRDLFTGIMAGDNIAASTMSVDDEKNDVISFMYNDRSFNDGNPIIIERVKANPNVIRLITENKHCRECKRYDLYLVESADGNKAMAMASKVRKKSEIQLRSGDPVSVNRKTNLDPEARSVLTPCKLGDNTNCFNYSPQATVRKIHLVSYSVTEEGILVRKTFGNNTGESAENQIQIQPIVNNVQNFQVKYLMQNGEKLDDPSMKNTEQFKMNKVVQIEVTITIKANNNEAGISSKALTKITSTFSTRNLRYDID